MADYLTPVGPFNVKEILTNSRKYRHRSQVYFYGLMPLDTATEHVVFELWSAQTESEKLKLN